ncbi:OLC1v1011798C2 [Oldenlandia corymbosa var. corymbosa]|uniref:Protoporphyrinogen oxidase n=1 Tax=Oldenlandia corymbosa var. corymbosa TaxID=529605 RepID=A0AAV1DUN5_OLDCO|nr:OLC1v1011798C2 [Oldenlandia corymbosa var. corymbosa]
MLLSSVISNTCSSTIMVAAASKEYDDFAFSGASAAKSHRVAVVGAGVSGLAAAYKLKLHGLNVTVFEAESRAGGKLKSVCQDGLIWDEGANTMTESDAEVGVLLDNLGLREKQQYPISQTKRYVARNGAPVLLPSDPIALVGSNFLSMQSKLQILLEPLLWKKNPSKGSNEQESVGGFFERHFGKEVVDYLIDPFVAGTSGGDPESLSMRYSFPELWSLEQRFGSIIAGAIQSKLSTKKGNKGGRKISNDKQRRGSFSFIGGMQTLTNALCQELGEKDINLQCKVLELSSGSHKGWPANDWTVSWTSPQKKIYEEKPFDAVVVTAPLNSLKEMKIKKGGSPFRLDFIPQVVCLPVSVVITTFKKERVKCPLEGFGVLVPTKEQQNGLKTLGTLFSSAMFPDRAPDDVHLYTTFVGGSRNKELAKASRDELKDIVTSDLRKLLGAEGDPAFFNHYYWSKAFPLYGKDYKSVIDAIDKLEKDLPGFFYAGKFLDSLSNLYVVL